MSTLKTVSLRGVRAMGIAACLSFGGLSASATTLDLAGSFRPAAPPAIAVDPSVQRAVAASLADASPQQPAVTFDRSRNHDAILLASVPAQQPARKATLTPRAEFAHVNDPAISAIQTLDHRRAAHTLYANFGRGLMTSGDAPSQTLLASSPRRSFR